eukprot:TRINITY_DN31_c0_g1_i1.p2 TRINITY_DN31_c0_g1~~TRINITY_DN31_c0_g1_i1.p2  ORF type:complete len:152 (-),score=29.76 TRINITY_DN31_c0_g1_i1:119-574(-)
MAKRLQKELSDFSTQPQPWLKSVALQGDQLYKWKAQIIGPDKTPYEKGIFTVNLDIPQEYPFKPPKVVVTTKTYHPNIKNEHDSGNNVCFPILTDSWSPQLKILDILKGIRDLLAEPNPDHPLDLEIAEVYTKDKTAFAKTAKEWTKKYAK